MIKSVNRTVKLTSSSGPDGRGWNYTKKHFLSKLLGLLCQINLKYCSWTPQILKQPLLGWVIGCDKDRFQSVMTKNTGPCREGAVFKELDISWGLSADY